MRSKALSTQILNSIAVIGTIAFLLGALLYMTLEAFSLGVLFGFRSLVACILPPLVMAYLNSSTDISYGRGKNQNFNLFFLHAVWMLMLLVLGSVWDFTVVPLIELLFSLTLASIWGRARKRNSESRVFACCYGILIGLLCYVCFFGITLSGF